MQYKRHPMALDLPDMDPEQFEALKNSIAEEGLIVPIMMAEGFIVDGWQRYRACHEVGATPRYVNLPANNQDVIHHTMIRNIHRRNMSKSQLAWNAAVLHNVSRGGRGGVTADGAEEKYSVARLAEMFAVSAATIERAISARKAIEDGRLKEAFGIAIRDDRIPVNIACEVIGQSDALQNDALENPKNIRALLRETKRKHRTQKVSDDAQALPDDVYQIVMMSPDWSRENLQKIRETKPKIDERALVYMWVSNEWLPEAIHTLEFWGLEYCATFVWQWPKDRPGKWVRDRGEFMVIARSEGGFDAPGAENTYPSIMTYPLGQGREKPEEIFDAIDEAYPSYKKLIMYGNVVRDDWDVWGFKAEGVEVKEEEDKPAIKVVGDDADPKPEGNLWGNAETTAKIKQDPPKRGRGRPRKNPAPEPEPEAEVAERRALVTEEELDEGVEMPEFLQRGRVHPEELEDEIPD